jgi:hypothetical protein
MDPDPYVRGTDPRIWIRTKMSRIPNTVVPVISIQFNPYLMTIDIFKSNKF